MASSHSVAKSCSVAGGRSAMIARARPSARKLAAERAQVGDQQRQQRGRDGGVDQQRLGRAADAGAAHLGIGQDGARHRRVGGRVDVGVAEPLGMGEHRHAGLLHHPRAPGPCRRAGRSGRSARRRAAWRRRRRGRRSARPGWRPRGSPAARSPSTRQAWMAAAERSAFRPAAQDHRIAGFQAEHRGIGGRRSGGFRRSCR